VPQILDHGFPVATFSDLLFLQKYQSFRYVFLYCSVLSDYCTIFYASEQFEQPRLPGTLFFPIAMS